jgi:hypothetical protein
VYIHVRDAASLSEMPRAQLQKHIEKNDAERSKLLTALINAGHGATKYNDLIKLAPHDPLVEQYRQNSERMHELHTEKEYRMKYQGTMHPVKKSKWL